MDSRGLLASQSSSNVSPGFSGKVYINIEESNKGRQLIPASGIHLSACTLFWPNALVFKVLRAFLIQDPVLVPTNLSLWLPLLPLCQCASSKHTTLSSVFTNVPLPDGTFLHPCTSWPISSSTLCLPSFHQLQYSGLGLCSCLIMVLVCWCPVPSLEAAKVPYVKSTSEGGKWPRDLRG